MVDPDSEVPLCYHAVVTVDPDGLAHGDGRVMAVGYRANPDTGWVSAYSWTGYGMTPSQALASLERVLRGRYGRPMEARRVRYEARE